MCFLRHQLQILGWFNEVFAMKNFGLIKSLGMNWMWLIARMIYDNIKMLYRGREWILYFIRVAISCRNHSLSMTFRFHNMLVITWCAECWCVIQMVSHPQNYLRIKRKFLSTLLERGNIDMIFHIFWVVITYILVDIWRHNREEYKL
jgi:hypothetical protein